MRRRGLTALDVDENTWEEAAGDCSWFSGRAPEDVFVPCQLCGSHQGDQESEERQLDAAYRVERNLQNRRRAIRVQKVQQRMPLKNRPLQPVVIDAAC